MSDELHQKIMNLPIPQSVAQGDVFFRIAYEAGHRDARHAAAELVAAIPQAVSAEPSEKALMQFTGDVMILSVLAESTAVNHQEREVLLRWIETSQPKEPQ